MSQKKLIIFEQSLLFNILNEISEVLNFDLIQADRNNLNDIKKKFTGDFLVISKEQNVIKPHYLVLKNFYRHLLILNIFLIYIEQKPYL